MTVHAVANPQQFGVTPHALNERAPGFGLVIFDKKARVIRLENYPRWADFSKAETYAGWPITIHQTDNGLNGAKWELRLPAKVSGLVRVVTADSKEHVVAWRSASPIDHIPLWSDGTYDVIVGSREFRRLQAVSRQL